MTVVYTKDTSCLSSQPVLYSGLKQDSERTVRFHVINVLGKLGVDNRVQAAWYALESGLVDVED